MFRHIGLLLAGLFVFAVTAGTPLRAIAATKEKETEKSEPVKRSQKSESGKSETKKGEPTKTEKEKHTIIDINTAPESELRSLPGITDADAKKIAANRPYKRKDQLVSKKIISKEEYEKIKDEIVAKQPKTK